MTEPLEVASPMAQVLDAVQDYQIPPNFGRPELDWNGVFKMPHSKNMLNQFDFTMRPCEGLVDVKGGSLEVQHHDGLVGKKDGPVGIAFANALCTQRDYLNNMQAVSTPNLAPPVRTCIVTKVKTQKLYRVLQLWGTAQQAFADAVCDCYEHEYFPDKAEEDLVITGGVFIHPAAGLTGGDQPQQLGKEEKEKHLHQLYCLCYVTTVVMLFDGITGGLTPSERLARRKGAAHPYLGFTFAA